jgi:hypothetical protein
MQPHGPNRRSFLPDGTFGAPGHGPGDEYESLGNSLSPSGLETGRSKLGACISILPRTNRGKGGSAPLGISGPSD